jgi:hypothetical protein
MSIRLWRFAAIMLAALTLGMAFGHMMELPARMAWDQFLWVGATVQGGLYRMFGTLGAIITVVNLIVLIVLLYLLRYRPTLVFRFTAVAAVLYAIALIVWWVVVYPVNVELARWVDGPVPADWTFWRAQWEWGHATIALLQFFGFGALVAATLLETPATDWPRTSD